MAEMMKMAFGGGQACVVIMVLVYLIFTVVQFAGEEYEEHAGYWADVSKDLPEANVALVCQKSLLGTCAGKAHGGQCYFTPTFTGKSLSWNQAKSTCETDGAVLAKIDSETVNGIVLELCNAATDKSWYCYIGLHRDSNKKWVWLDGDVAPTWSNWADGEPSSANDEEEDARSARTGKVMGAAGARRRLEDQNAVRNAVWMQTAKMDSDLQAGLAWLAALRVAWMVVVAIVAIVSITTGICGVTKSHQMCVIVSTGCHGACGGICCVWTVFLLMVFEPVSWLINLFFSLSMIAASVAGCLFCCQLSPVSNVPVQQPEVKVQGQAVAQPIGNVGQPVAVAVAVTTQDVQK